MARKFLKSIKENNNTNEKHIKNNFLTCFEKIDCKKIDSKIISQMVKILGERDLELNFISIS